MLIETDELRQELQEHTKRQVDLIDEAVADHKAAIDLLLQVRRNQRQMEILIDRVEAKIIGGRAA
jgi:uncharacterized protein Yka (UPF0111/DUF47 family)